MTSATSPKKPAFQPRCLIVFKREGEESPDHDELPDKQPNQQVSQQGEFERFLHQNRQKISKPLLLRSERSN